MTRKAKLKQALAAIVDAMLPEEKPSPPPAKPPSAPNDHSSHITADLRMCCARHDAEFERRAAESQRLMEALGYSTELAPGVSPQARDHIAKHLDGPSGPGPLR
jgi:hypothetical protein